MGQGWVIDDFGTLQPVGIAALFGWFWSFWVDNDESYN